MIRSLFIAAMSIACATLCGAARANEFTAVAAGCVPDPANIQGNDYFVTAGTVKHQANRISDIHLRCPISIVITKPSHIYLIASSTPASSVTAQLSSKDNISDGGNAWCSVGADQAPQDGTVHLIDVACSDLPVTWDQTMHAWYLEITIHRRNLLHIAVFYGAGVY